MIRIIIADDHDIVRDGVRRILETKDDLKVVGEAGTGRETIELCNRQKADVLLLDLDMPDMDGLEVTKQIISSHPDVKILILTMHDDAEYAERVMKAGASGFVLKASSPNELPDIVRKVTSGKIYVHPSILEKTALRQYRPAKVGSVSALSDREHQVIIMLARGMRLREIADELNLSTSTVATHKKRLMDKLGLKKNVDLMSFTAKHGLVDKRIGK